MSAAGPDPSPPELRVDNRSDRVWVYGYLRLVPGVLWLGGLFLFFLAVRYLPRMEPVAGMVVLAVILIGPLILDRSTLLDPVNYVLLGDRILVQRLAGKRELPAEGLMRIDVVRPEGEDYDEKQRARRFAELTLQFRGNRRARLLATHEDAVRVAGWAAARNIPVVDRPY